MDRRFSSPGRKFKIIHTQNYNDDQGISSSATRILQNKYGYDQQNQSMLKIKARQGYYVSELDTLRKKPKSPNRLFYGNSVNTTRTSNFHGFNTHRVLLTEYPTTSTANTSFNLTGSSFQQQPQQQQQQLNRKDEEFKYDNTRGGSNDLKLNKTTITSTSTASTIPPLLLTENKFNSGNVKNDISTLRKLCGNNNNSSNNNNNTNSNNSVNWQLNDLEKTKIHYYFRTRIATLVKIIDEKSKKNLSLYKGSKTSKKKEGYSQMLGNDQNLTQPSNTLDPYIEEILKDDIWKALKRLASTRSKYKIREVVNFNKKIQHVLKTMSSNMQLPKTSEIEILLNDEEDTPIKKKATIEKKSIMNEYYMNSLGKYTKKLDLSNKIFIIIGGYRDLKKALESRGWIENPDSASKIFNLKWTLKKADLNFLELMPHQLVNHFEKNTSITTKVGLARNIRNLIWFENEDVDHFYPRCYDLNDVTDFDDFIEDFKYTGAQAILKSLDGFSLPTGCDLDLFKVKLIISLEICERQSKNPGEIIQMMLNGKSISVRQYEWDIIMAPNFSAVLNHCKRYEAEIKRLLNKYDITIGTPREPSNLFESHLFTKVENMLNFIEKTHPQFSLNGQGNIWIIKPASLSRGRGINCYNNIHDIFAHIQVQETEWVAQKYIENPLIIQNKKFDIRQWVLVTDWNPLTIWFYDECYIRFGADEYDPNNLGNRFSHLTNNSIAKHSEKFENSDIDGNMWTCMEFADYFKVNYGQDEFYERIQPKMKQSVIRSLQCVQDMVENRKNSFELYGYDFMIDNYFKPWLIEINSSPAMDYSTSVTERLVKMVLEDCIKVIIDYGMSKTKNKKNINTGSFKCIYEGKSLI